MTRSEVRALEYKFPMPKEKEGMKKVFEEVQIAGGGQDTREDAMVTLRKIQAEKRQSSGWYCEGGMNSGVFQDIDGRWYAYRHHAKYE